jgi:hypothetical protein
MIPSKSRPYGSFVLARGASRRAPARRSRARTTTDPSPASAASLNGTFRSMPWQLERPVQRLADELSIAGRPEGYRALAERLLRVRNDAGGIEVVDGAETLAFGTRAMRRVEREGSGRHLGHADAAFDAGKASRGSSLSPPFERVDDDGPSGKPERRLHRFGRRRSTPGLTMSRSTRTSIEWLRRRSSEMSSSSDRNWPSTRTRVNPLLRKACRSFLNSPLRPRPREPTR